MILVKLIIIRILITIEYLREAYIYTKTSKLVLIIIILEIVIHVQRY